MHRRIPRRDFLNGVAMSVTALGLRRKSVNLLAQDSPAYPPALTGLRGNTAAAVETFAAMERGAYRQFPAIDTDSREVYDLVIVGAGISGLAAAYFWRRALGARQKILILD